MKIRKAVILAGGNATRLYPVTLATNKHLLPLYNKPVIFYAIERLVDAGISRIMIVTNPQHLDDFARVLGSGERWKPKHTGESQIQITYAIQNTPSGIADGLWIAKEYVEGEPCALYLGDNYIEDDLGHHLTNFTGGATVFLKSVPDPERFGVAEVRNDGSVISIEEKPTAPRSNLAVVGLYLYDKTVFDKIHGMKPSARGEYEITSINNMYAKEGSLKAAHLEKPWFDIGTHDALLQASIHVHQRDTHLHKK